MFAEARHGVRSAAGIRGLGAPGALRAKSGARSAAPRRRPGSAGITASHGGEFDRAEERGWKPGDGRAIHDRPKQPFVDLSLKRLGHRGGQQRAVGAPSASWRSVTRS